MYAAASQSERIAIPEPAAAPVLERAEGRIRLSFRADAGTSRLEQGYQQGSFKVRFPNPRSAVPEAVLLNTAGGMTGGDRFSVEAGVGDHAAATVTTQAAERIYRSPGDEAQLDVALTLGHGARLDWLPQETILFDEGRLSRRLDATMAGDARLLICEAVVLGRAAHGETVRGGKLSDRWRVRRDGRLIYADALRLEGDIQASIAGRATLAGARAFATLVHVAPDAEAALDRMRVVLERAPAQAGASAWDGMLAVRLVAEDGARLRLGLLEALAAFGVAVPRVWLI